MIALDEFIEATMDLKKGELLRSPHDPNWLSDCEQYQENGYSYWHPVRQKDPVDFLELENALEVKIHKDIKNYYGAYWSGTLEGNTREGPLSLIQLWNPEDYKRLIGNLIGHALSKKKHGAPLTIFFATTEPESEFFLSLENQSGAVFLEEPSTSKMTEIDSNIHRFLKRLAPSSRETVIY